MSDKRHDLTAEGLYGDLVGQGDRELTISASAEEQCVVLKAYDYGVPTLSEDEIIVLNRVIGSLKNEIWP